MYARVDGSWNVRKEVAINADMFMLETSYISISGAVLYHFGLATLARTFRRVVVVGWTSRHCGSLPLSIVLSVRTEYRRPTAPPGTLPARSMWTDLSEQRCFIACVLRPEQVGKDLLAT